MVEILTGITAVVILYSLRGYSCEFTVLGSSAGATTSPAATRWKVAGIITRDELLGRAHCGSDWLPSILKVSYRVTTRARKRLASY